ncbi:class II histocompatibility antigen, B-L beta chain-like [Passerculus sandwichensis]
MRNPDGGRETCGSHLPSLRKRQTTNASGSARENHTAVFLHMGKQECYFINGTEKVRSVERLIYNREQYLVYDSDVGLYVGFNPYGAMNARRLNNDPMWLEYQRTSEEWFCRVWYEGSTPFITERRVSPSGSISLVPPSSSQPGPGRLLCFVMEFYPAAIHVRWFKGQQELSEHVVATDVLPNGNWTHQLLMPPDAACSKMLTGIGGFVLGFVFLALGLGFSLRKKVRAGAGGGVPAVAERVRSRRGPSPCSQ